MNRARKQRIRELDAKRKLQEQQELLENAKRLKSMKGGFSRSEIEREAQRNFVFKVPGRVEPFLPAKFDGPPIQRKRPKLDKSLLDELSDREKKAKQKLAELKSRVGVVFNKGGYQYLTDSDLEDERAGKTRRRS